MTTLEYSEICELREKLEEYGNLEETSHGEAVRALCFLSSYPDYITDELWDAVVDAMQYELKNFTDNAKIVTLPMTFTRDVIELKWNDEL